MRVNLKDPAYVKLVKQDIHTLFDSPQGKEVMAFLEQICGWYTGVFDPANRDLTLINEGKRQVVATIKSIQSMTVEEIVQWVKSKEGA